MTAADHYAEAQRHLDDAAKSLQSAAHFAGSPYRQPTIELVADAIYLKGRVERFVKILGTAPRGRR